MYIMSGTSLPPCTFHPHSVAFMPSLLPIHCMTCKNVLQQYSLAAELVGSTLSGLAKLFAMATCLDRTLLHNDSNSNDSDWAS